MCARLSSVIAWSRSQSAGVVCEPNTIKATKNGISVDGDEVRISRRGNATSRGCAVSSRRVLSALSSATFEDFAHVVWDSRLSVAEAPARAIAATHVIFWEQAPGQLTDQQTAFDHGRRP